MRSSSPCCRSGVLHFAGGVSPATGWTTAGSGFCRCSSGLSATCCAALTCRRSLGDLPAQFMVAAACCELLCFVVSLRWKISLHLTGMGAVVALLVVMNVAGVGNMVFPLVVAVLAAGALASARLYLGVPQRSAGAGRLLRRLCRSDAGRALPLTGRASGDR